MSRTGSATSALQPYAYAVLGGLLSSQCCVIQLALNAMSVGCAGFSVLSPYRPAFLAVTTAGLLYTHRKYRNPRQTLCAAIVALALSASPEVVRAYNMGIFRHLAQYYHLPGVLPKHLLEQIFELQVDGIKCVSCGMRIKQHVLSSVKGVQNCTVEFEKGRVMVAGKGVSRTQLLESISSLGYVPRVTSFKESAPLSAKKGGKKSSTSQGGSEL
eukprot:jgi/Botrbrau1/8000/Bobra.384_2s0026.1